jgi:pimeloyl-ACP methyl ester carboxylesterase
MYTIQQWQSIGQTVKLLGHDIFYIDVPAVESKRGTIFLIHGFPTSSWDWVSIWSDLTKHYRLIALDMLGFGFSEKPNPHSYSIHQQADICETLIGHLNLDEFHVLAHDYGDTVAQEMLARQNSGVGVGRWQSSCFLNGGLFPETHKARLVQKLLLSPIGGLVNKLSGKKQFEKSFSAVFGQDTKPSQQELDNFWRLICLNQGDRLFYRMISYMSDRKQHRERWLSALINAGCPIGLINGSADPVSGAHMVARFIELLGNNYFISEHKALGHYPQVEGPQEVLSAYKAFLTSLSS